MPELKLYTTKENLKYSSWIAAGCFAFGTYQLLFTGMGFDRLLLGLAGTGYGLWLGVTTMRQMKNPVPVFEADEAGFSVKGKPKRPWSEFRLVDLYVRKSRAGSTFSQFKSVRIKVGASMFSGSVKIKPLQMSASPEKMVVQIEQFAHDMKMKQAGRSEAHQPDDPFLAYEVGKPIPTGEKIPQETSKTDVRLPEPALRSGRSNAGHDGPIESVPSFGDRLFGRRNVI